MTQYGFHFDGTRCTGCKTCVLACKDKNNLDVGMAYRRVCEYTGGTTEKGADGNPAFIATPEGYTDPEWKFVNGLDTNAPTWASADFVTLL